MALSLFSAGSGGSGSSPWKGLMSSVVRTGLQNISTPLSALSPATQTLRFNSNTPNGRSSTVKARVKKTTLEQITAPLGSFLGTSIHRGDVIKFTKSQIGELLTTDDPALVKALYTHANSVTQRFFGNKVHFRGIVEFSNVCTKDCYYCGIRKHMKGLERYTMPKEEIYQCADFCHQARYGTLMLQSGEVPTAERLEWLQEVIKEIRRRTIEQDKLAGIPDPKGLGIALSVGELTYDEYKKLYDAGAHRYLLRIETSNPELYKKLHPKDHSWHTRRDCLRLMKKAGFQIGTGVMIGIPHQTIDDLASDIHFFDKEEIDMIGMGPYIIEPETPLGQSYEAKHPERTDDELLELCMRMIATSRIVLGDANFAATTALQALDPIGREIALNRGANIMMPILTPTKYREEYQLYAGKPCITEDASDCRSCLENRVMSSGKTIGLGEWGDPHSFERRRKGLKL